MGQERKRVIISSKIAADLSVPVFVNPDFTRTVDEYDQAQKINKSTLTGLVVSIFWDQNLIKEQAQKRGERLPPQG